ncbi:hypothetical protein FACS1894107_12080 [Planctomycetales bacterium]|nr:hypothetical protein FACS1894107_12080 [Planctomycetales bacterium]GHT00470.1 hypothetical protein FACS1894108_12600 [Planctomycetales bacterium]
MLAYLKKLLAHPLLRDLAIDDPRTTELRRRVIVEKPFLRRLYREWYDRLWATLPPSEAGDVLEIGSGGGFLQEIHPEVITSECFPCAGVNRVIDAQALPFADQSLRGIVMVDVLHHIPNAEKFLSEATRCLRGGGRSFAGGTVE